MTAAGRSLTTPCRQTKTSTTSLTPSPLYQKMTFRPCPGAVQAATAGARGEDRKDFPRSDFFKRMIRHAHLVAGSDTWQGTEERHGALQTRYSGLRTIWTPLSVATFFVVSIRAALLAAVCSAIGLLRLCKAKRGDRLLSVHDREPRRRVRPASGRTRLKCLMSCGISGENLRMYSTITRSDGPFSLR